MKKLSFEAFLERARTTHNDLYQYSECQNFSNTKKIPIICPRHGLFHQLPRKHLEGQGCQKCASKNNKLKSVRPWTYDEDQYIINNFNKKNISELALDLKRGRNFLKQRILELGLNRTHMRAAKFYKDIKLSKFESYKRGAQVRNLSFEIGIDDIWQLFLKQGRKCALTGWTISFKNPETASVDRIDSSLGYTKDNIQIVHKNINILKMDWSESFLFDASKAIFLNCKEKHKRKEIKWAVDNWHDTEHPFYAEVSDDENYQPIVRKYDDLF